MFSFSAASAISADYLNGSRSWVYYKNQEAPQFIPRARFSASALIWVSTRKGSLRVTKRILPPKACGKGQNSYRRPPSFVADNFLVTNRLRPKPHQRGYHLEWVRTSRCITKLLKSNKPLSKENLWPINKNSRCQGRAYAAMLATLIGP